MSKVPSRKRASGSKARYLGLLGCLASVAVAHGCSSDEYYCDAYGYCYAYYPYAYDYYYPADMAYADVYYADYAYGYPTAYALTQEKSVAPGSLPGTALRRLATGENLCPDHSTITTTGGATPCELGGTQAIPVSRTVQLDGCVIPGGGQLDGTIQIDANLTLSDATCAEGTVIDVSLTSTTTGLSYTAPGGSRVVVPALTRTGSYSRVLGQQPTSVTFNVDGSIEHYDDAGRLVGNHTARGTQTLTFLGAGAGYSLDGALTLEDAVTGDMATLSGTGVTRTEDCCHPTSGLISIDRTPGDDATWSFGPTCGQVRRNEVDVELRDCY